jgi:predicted nucleotidyltransferase
MDFTKDIIISESNVHPLKVRNIYLYGSRIYGTASPDSDWDIICVTAALLEHEEKRVKVGNDLLNIHLITPDKFQRGLDNHDIMNLECYFSPEWARLQEKLVLKFELNKKKLAKNIISQSFVSWQGGKHKINNGDIYRGLKSIFHSLKMLLFAIQIAEHGKIINFSEANYLHHEIHDCDEFEYGYFVEKYMPFKMDLEDKLKELTKL